MVEAGFIDRLALYSNSGVGTHLVDVDAHRGRREACADQSLSSGAGSHRLRVGNNAAAPDS
jgi:hypothetical protein